MRIFFKIAPVLGVAAALASTTLEARPADEHGPAWLDVSRGAKALRWVAAERKRTLAVLEADPRFATMRDEAAEILNDPSRPQKVTFIGSETYQHFQSREQPLGSWRRTATAAYLAAKPNWETVIDLDALAARDKKKWIFAGASCRARRCLVQLSDNGKDAVETREFDLDKKSFVPGGFFIPASKSRTWWLDDNRLLVAPTLGPDSINVSLLPKTLRVWTRGTPLASTKPIFSIGQRDAMLSVMLVHAGGTESFVAARHLDFETREYQLLNAEGMSRPLPLPSIADVMGSYAGKLLLRPRIVWAPSGTGRTFAAGTLVAISLDPLMKEARIADAELVYTPAGDDAVRGVVTDGDRIFVELLHDYYSRIVELKRNPQGWGARTLPLPSGRFLTSMGFHDGRLLIQEEAPLVPEKILLADPNTGAGQVLYARDAAFDASRLVTELYHTASRDGTTIDYTITHPRDMKLDGTNPTLVYGYGGYDVPLTPRYEPIFGKLWMERGGVYVHAYLRGGGEHGPAWHRGPMRKNRQQPFDDMQAVLRDIHRRGISSPPHTGIMGRSNGGLMTAVVMEQTPELTNAAIVGGPLTDMLNFDQLPPGGTWLAEYGDPRDPDMAAFLRTYSPMQNIAGPERHYPAPLIITGTDDDRVLPGHARRFGYQLAAKGHDRLYFEDAQGGHYWELAGGPAPGEWRPRAVARAVELTYLWQRLGKSAKQP